MNTQENKEHLANMAFARSYLYVHGMLTEKENNNVHQKILKYQDKESIIISKEELDSVEFLHKKLTNETNTTI